MYHYANSEKKDFIYELKGTYKCILVKNIKRLKKTLMFTKLRWELLRARPPHGVDVPELHS